MTLHQKKIFYPIELFTMVREGQLIPGKSKLKTDRGIFTFIKVSRTSNMFEVVLENSSRESFIFDTREFRALNCETTQPRSFDMNPG